MRDTRAGTTPAGRRRARSAVLRLGLGVLLVGLAPVTVRADDAVPPEAAGRAAFHTSLAGTLVPVLAGTAWALASPADDTVPGIALAAIGVYLGPATGYLAHGAPRRGLTGVGTRALVSVATCAVAAGVVITSYGSGGEDALGPGENVAIAVLSAGALAVAGSAAWDIAHVGRLVGTAPSAGAGVRSSTMLGLTPAGPGVAFVARF